MEDTTMKEPSATQAYSMIRFLKKRAEKGDALKIAELQKIIDAAKDKQAQLDVDKYFSK